MKTVNLKSKVMVLMALFTMNNSLFTSAAKVADYEVVPLPQSIQAQKGDAFVLNDDVQILAAEGLQSEAAFLQQYLSDVTGIKLTLAQKRVCSMVSRLCANHCPWPANVGSMHLRERHSLCQPLSSAMPHALAIAV